MNGSRRPRIGRAYVRTLLCLAAAGALLIILGWVFRFQLLTEFASYLVIEEACQPADILFLLNGGVDTRPFCAAELFARGLARQIVMARAEDTPAVRRGLYPNATDVAVEILLGLGVPREKVTVLERISGVSSTREEALVLRDYLESHRAQRVLLVTSEFHTRRSRWIFEKELRGKPVVLCVAGAPSGEFNERNWWCSEAGVVAVANEYIKLLYYRVAYRR